MAGSGRRGRWQAGPRRCRPPAAEFSTTRPLLRWRRTARPPLARTPGEYMAAVRIRYGLAGSAISARRRGRGA